MSGGDIKASEGGLSARVGALIADFARQRGGAAALVMLLVLLAAGAEAFGLATLAAVVTLALSAQAAGLPVIGGLTADQRLAMMLGAFLAASAIRLLVGFERDRRLARLQTDYVARRRLRLAERLAGARWSAVAALDPAQVLQAMAVDTQRLGAAVSLLCQSGVALATVALQLGLMAVAAPGLLAPVALIGLAAVALSWAPGHRAHRLGQEFQQKSVALGREVTEYLGGLKAAVAQDLQGRHLEGFRSAIEGAGEAQAAFQSGQALGRALLGLAVAAAACATLYLGAVVLRLPTAALALFALAAARLAPLVVQLGQTLPQLANLLPAHERLKDLTAALAEQQPAPPRPAAFDWRAPLRVEAAVVPRPGGGLPILDAASLELAPGEFIGLSGPSGGGKTTLLDLLVALVEPMEGRVSLGGLTLDEAAAPDFRRHIAYVPQAPAFHHGSVRQALQAGPDQPDADIWAALDLVGAAPLVQGLPERLDAPLQAGAQNLSGGERQRLAIARAILRRPRLLLLDEATNALDPEAEAALLQALAALTPRPTILLVAHREASLAACDRVLWLDAGRVLQPGRTAERAGASC